MKLQKINYQNLTKYYLIGICAIFLIICSIHQPGPVGEWDDYFMPSVTLTNSHPHISVYQADIDRAAEMFPQWARWIKKNMLFSPFKTHSGGMIPWYFPTYGIACIPLVLLLPVSNKIYAFPFTNFLVLAAMLFIVYKKLQNKLASQNLFLLTVLISLNPIIFYLNWISGEVFIYSVFGMALTFWHCKEWKKAAFCISLIGSMNPVIMIAGIALIADYFYEIGSKKNYGGFKDFAAKNLKPAFLFGCCFIYALFPFVYAKLSTGKFNILISGNKKNPFSSMFSYFLAYLFDLNFGVLPYYNFVFACFLALFVSSIVRRKWRFVFMSALFFALVAGYCKQFHINCGMSGIARYNAWSVLLILFAFVFYLEKNAGKIMKKVQKSCIFLTAIFSLLIITHYSPIMSKRAPYTSFTPIAKFVLDNFPSIYNPIPTTFNSRTIHRDGGYKIELPVIYNGTDGNVRKILASKNEADFLSDYKSADEKANLWFQKKIALLTEKSNYISVPKNFVFNRYPILQDSIIFFGDDYNASEYAKSGISGKESQHTWTNGKSAKFLYRHSESAKGKIMHADFHLLAVYHDSQRISVKINGKEMLSGTIMGDFGFDYRVPDSCFIEMELELPDAVSPKALGESGDSRLLALALKSIDFAEVSSVDDIDSEFSDFALN